MFHRAFFPISVFPLTIFAPPSRGRFMPDGLGPLPGIMGLPLQVDFFAIEFPFLRDRVQLQRSARSPAHAGVSQ
jgi:hypothetical protein